MQTPTIEISGRKIGLNQQTFIIAELSANHNQDFNQARQLIQSAREAGADAVKIQTYTADTITINSQNKYFRVSGGTLWDNQTLHDLYSEAFTPWEWQPHLKKEAEDLGLIFFSTPFDFSAVDFLEGIDVPCWKVASFEIVDLPLIQKMAQTGKPILISTGMATLGEIEEAVTSAREAGATDLALLKCTSAYPAPPEEMNLKTISHMAEAFNVPAGLSDHTIGITAPIAAVALGASIIEKHLTISRKMVGPDSAFSLEPQEFKEMCNAVRDAEKAIGKVNYNVGKQEAKSLNFRRSLFVVEDVKTGEKFTATNVRSIRPAHGLAPKYYKDILGKVASEDIERGTPLNWDLVKGGS